MVGVFRVSEHDGAVEVIGLPLEEVEQAITIYQRNFRPLGELSTDLVGGALADTLDTATAQAASAVEALMTTTHLTPPASLVNVQRLAARRDALLATPTLTLPDLAKLRGQQDSSARTWFYRQKAKGKLFSVTYSGNTLIPAFQLTDDGGVRPELQDLIAPLQAAKFDGWAIWHWLTSPTSWLSGETPEQIAVNDPERARVAADRLAARPAA